MNRTRVSLFFLTICSSSFGFDKLDSKYWVQYGNPQAKWQIVEYFSLSCSKCLEFFKNDFPAIKKKHIDSGDVFWTLHPDPSDLLTLQAMVCLDRLPPKQRVLFLEAIMNHLSSLDRNEHGGQLMQAAMEVFQEPLPDLEQVEFLKNTRAFQDAYEFVTQEGIVTVIPSIEINGILYDEYPTLALIDASIRSQEESP
jgi:Thioredoxin